MLSSFTSYIIKENLNSDGQQSQSYQENKQTPLTSILWTQNGKMYAFIQQTKYPEPLAGNVTSPKKPIKMTFKPRVLIYRETVYRFYITPFKSATHTCCHQISKSVHCICKNHEVYSLAYHQNIAWYKMWW